MPAQYSLAKKPLKSTRGVITFVQPIVWLLGCPLQKCFNTG